MKDSSAIINAAIQTSGIIGVQFLGYVWAIYPAMILICILICAQTVAASYYLAGRYKLPDVPESAPKSMPIMVCILYFATAYQAYLLGFEVFSGLAVAHSLIMLLTILAKKQEKIEDETND